MNNQNLVSGIRYLRSRKALHIYRFRRTKSGRGYFAVSTGIKLEFTTGVDTRARPYVLYVVNSASYIKKTAYPTGGRNAHIAHLPLVNPEMRTTCKHVSKTTQ